MKNNRIITEISSISHILTLVTITMFSVVLIILDCILKWDLWMIPVITAGAAACVVLHISGKLPPRARIFIYGSFLIFEAFYYAVNIDTVYDSTAIVVIMSFIFSLTGERALVRAGVLGGMAGMGLHLIYRHFGGSAEGGTGLILQPGNITRVIWQFILILIAAFIADRISSAWNNTEEQYRKKIDEVMKDNESANNFLANVSHEIRTPINAVLGLSAIMEKEEMSDQVRGRMSAIAEAGRRIAGRIEDIMDLTEIDTKKLSVTRETYMITSIINDLTERLRAENSITADLVIDLSPEVPYELVGDGSKIKKILRHLISNAFKFTKDGGVCVSVTCRERGYGVNLVFEITDTGVGMTDEELAHIYDKFYQSDSGRSRAAGGLGLGIPIVNGFVRAMGGFLYIESTPGQGTLVRVSIPQEVADPSPCISVSDKENVRAAGFLGFMTTKDPRVREFYMEMIGRLVDGLGVPFMRTRSIDELKDLLTSSYRVTHLFVGTGEYQLNKGYIDSLTSKMNVVLVEDRDFGGEIGSNIALLPKPFCGAQAANFLNCLRVGPGADNRRLTCPGVRALVVDDEPMNLLVARGIFESYGMTVSTAPGGEESIRMCAEDDFDIIFMDHMMPGMDGVEAMKRLRADASKRRKELCIVALTANAASTAKEMFLSEGFDGFIPKPIELTDLERVLRHVLPVSAIVYEYEPAVIPSVMPAAPETSAPAADDPYQGLRACGVDTDIGLRYCQNDADFYRQLLSEYAKDSAHKLEELSDYYVNKDLKAYGIRVHAIKSTSKMIGAVKLSDTAKALESAAKDEDTAFISAEHEAFLKQYGQLMESIAAFTGDTKAFPDNDSPMEFLPDGDEPMEFLPGGES